MGVNLHRCPYDGTPIEAEAYSGGSFLLVVHLVRRPSGRRTTRSCCASPRPTGMAARRAMSEGPPVSTDPVTPA